MKTLTVTHGFSGNRLKKPFKIKVQDKQTPEEEKLLEYILKTFTGRRNDLTNFTLENKTTMQVAKHYLVHCTGSDKSLLGMVVWVHNFCRKLNVTPDSLVAECLDEEGFPIPKVIARVRHDIDDFIMDLRSKGLAPRTAGDFASCVKVFFNLNDVKLELPYSLRRNTITEYRAFALVEVQKILGIANLRDKVVISMMASGGFRPSTLVKLEYRHIKHDLECNMVPLHVRVESNITKGKYRSYCTFLGKETVDYLRAYLSLRRYKKNYTVAEVIEDNSPLIARLWRKEVKALEPNYVDDLVHVLCVKAGLLTQGTKKRRNELTAYSLRKFFQTELATCGVHQACIDYMMGHKISSYLDIDGKGVEYLRNIYQSSGFSLQLKTPQTKIEALKDIMRKWDLDPEEILKAENSNEKIHSSSTADQKNEDEWTLDNGEPRFTWSWLYKRK